MANQIKITDKAKELIDKKSGQKEATITFLKISGG